MALFERQKLTTATAELTSQIADEIYDLLIAGKKPHEIFSEDGYDMNHIRAVIKEGRRIEKEGVNYIIANPETNAPGVVAALSSSILDVTKVGSDIIKFNPTYDAERTFADFKSNVLGL